MTTPGKKAVILLSGGLDSSTVTAIALDQGYQIYCLSFNYGQRNLAELKAAKRVASFFKVEQHYVVNVDLGKIGGSALTDDIKVPKNQNLDDLLKNDIEIDLLKKLNWQNICKQAKTIGKIKPIYKMVKKAMDKAGTMTAINM